MNSQAFDQFILTNDLRKALDRNEFFLQYQPQVDLETGQITAVEALIRWQHPQRGLLMPKNFIGIAEVTGEIVAIDEWVLQTACAQCREWQLAQLPPVRVAVNLSVQQLERQEAIGKISQILAATGLAPQFLEIEITERVAMQNIEFTIDLLETLKDQGVHISIDDFGTGHSSLAVLKHFPLHTLKIAREFIQDLPTNPQDIAVVQTIISLALGLNLKTIAEGVETLDQKEFLRQHQCDAMQGYLTSHPLSAEGITRLLMNSQVSQSG